VLVATEKQEFHDAPDPVGARALSAGGRLLLDAWRSSPAATGDVAAPSQMEQSTEVAGGPSQLVRSDRLFGLLPGRSLRFAKR
jgi:hypothetical protein